MAADRDVDEPRAHPWVWVVLVLLFAASVPWYLPAGSMGPLWLGLPHWVVLSLGATAGIAFFTAWVVARYWADAPDASDDDDRPERRPQ